MAACPSIVSGPVASARSLINWLKTFDVPEANCTKLEELSSGHALLKCLESVVPGAVCAGMSSPWDELWRIMEEYCQCSLDKSISVSELASGNEEHIARVVVLLLYIAAASKDNERIIERIKSLDESDQRDIMFYIQRTMTAISTSSIADGSMTSGIGEVLPDLEDQVSPTSLSQPSTPVDSPVPNSFSLSQMLTYSTPRAPTKANSFKSGEAGSSRIDLPNIRFISPAVVKSHPLSRSQVASPILHTPKPTPFKLSAEIPRLRHRIAVLEGMVETHRKNADEYYSELCAKSKDNDTLTTENNQLKEKVAHLEELRDVQDELDQTNLNLSKAEKNMERLKSENESLRRFRDRVKELEGKLEDYDLTHTKLHEYKERVDKMSLVILEKTSSLNEITVAHRTIQGQLEGKTAELESLLQQNRESSRELKEVIQKCKSLEEEKIDLQTDIEKKAESEQCLMSESENLKAQLAEVRGQLSAAQREEEGLAERLKSLEADYASYRTHVDGSLQDAQRENESLKVKISMKEGELENEAMEKQSLAEKVTQLENERQQLSVVLKKVQDSTRETISSLLQEKEFLSSDLATKQSSLAQQASEREAIEERLASLTRELDDEKSQMTSKESELAALSATKADLEKDVAQLRSELTRTLESCEAKENALVDCKAELTEKDELIMALSSEKVKLLEQLDQLRSNLDNMNTKYNGLVQDIDNLRRENASIERELDVLIAKNTEAEKQSVQVKSSNEELTGQLQKLREEFEDEKKCSIDKDSTISSLSADKANLEQQVVHLQEDCDRLSKELEASNFEFKSQLSTRDERAKVLEEQHTSLTKEMEAKMAQLEEALSEKEKEMNLLMSSTKNTLEERITELQGRLQAKESEIEQRSASLDACESQLNTMSGLVSSLKSEKKEIEDEMAKVKTDYANLEEELQAKEVERKEHSASLDECKRQLGAMEGLVSSCESEKKVLAEEIASLKSDCTELRDKLRAKEVEMEESLASVESYKDQLSTMNGLVSSLESEKIALNEKVGELENSYERKRKEDEIKVGKCHEVVVKLKSEIEQAKESLEERSRENNSLQASLAKSEEELTAIREKREASRKQFEEERQSMKEEILELEQRLGRQLQESRTRYQQMSAELELSQQKHTSELERLAEENRSLRARQDELYSQLRDENIETLRKQNKLYEEVDKLRERERETTVLCREYKDTLEKERERATSANDEVKVLQDKLSHFEEQREKEVGQLQEDLDRVLREQRHTAAEKKSLVAQLSYASEKLKSLEKSKNQLSPPPSRRSSRYPKRDPLIGQMSVSTISGISADTQEDHLEHEGSDDHLQTEADNDFTFRSSSASLRSTLEGYHNNASGHSTILTEDGHSDGQRITELQRRNATYLPHLKSSYPIETQTQRESPSVCDEQIKNGSKYAQASKLQETTMSSQLKPVAFELSLETDPLLSSTVNSGERKRTREKELLSGSTTVRSPATKSRRLGDSPRGQSSPVTKQYSRTFTAEARRSSKMVAGLKLREFLDKHDTNSGDTVDKGMSFTVSPPNGKGKGQLPKRLQENISKREEALKKRANARRETMVKSKKTRKALKSKN